MVAREERRRETPPADQRGMALEVAVYRAGRVYRAVCLDLGLIVERPSARTALDELRALMRDYVHERVEAGQRWDQILRPVPDHERRYVYGRLALAEFLRALALALPRNRGRSGAAGDGIVIHQFCTV